jgi:hydrogenase maturation protease
MNRLPAIVGVGNTLMGDDGVGPAAVVELGRRGVGQRAELIDAGLAFGEVLCDLEPSQPLIVIDAVRGGGRPGTVYQLRVDELAAEAGSPISLHEVNVLPALRMEALAGRDFADVTVLGVEPAELSWGEGLSDCMADAMEELIRAVVALLDGRRRPASCAGQSPARRSED